MIDKTGKAFLIVMLLVLTIGFIDLAVAEETTQQYAKSLLEPFYRLGMNGDETYNYTFNFHPADRVGDVESAIINFQLWLNPTITFDILVNGQACNTPSYTVHTTYANAGEGNIFFDCSNVITEAGTYTVTLTPDDDTGAITGWIDITYSNHPKGQIEVHGTEYKPGDNAKVWVQLLDAEGNDVSTGACQVDIYTPTNEELLENAAMTNTQHDGIYAYDLTAPQAQGVYPAIAKCYYNVTQIVNNATGFTLTTGTLDAGTYLLTDLIDGQEHKINELAGRLDFYYDFDNMCGLTTDELLLTGMTVTTNSKWKDSVVNDDIIISVYNFTSSSWIDLDNKIISPNDRVTVSNFIPSNNYTRDGLVDASGTARVRMRDTLGVVATEKIEVDQLVIQCEEFSSPIWTEVKGSSELHISSDYLWVTQVESGEITNDTWTGDFIYNVTLSSQTSRFEEEQEIFVELPNPFPCHHVNQLFVDGVELSWTPEQPVAPLRAGCSVNWIQDLNQSQNYDVTIIAQNYFKEEEQSWITQGEIEHTIVDTACRSYQTANNLTNYTIPATTPLDYQTEDAMWRVCQQYLDGFYHFNYTYFTEYRTPAGVFTEADMLALDELYAHLTLVKNDLDQLGTSIMNNMQLAGTYSTYIQNNTLPSNLDYLGWFAGISSNYDLFTGLTSIITGAINVAIDPVPVTNAIWNYTAKYTHGVEI